MTEPYYQDNAVTIYHGDCREILPQLEPADLVLTDPPYGINYAHKQLGKIFGDEQTPDVRDLLDIGGTLILWGAQHFAPQLPKSTRWLMWLKHDPGLFGKRDHAPFELAWTNLKGSMRAYKHIWDASIRQGQSFGLPNLHPAEKPVELLRWCLSFTPDAKTILDPFMGSGTTLRAAKDLGRKAIGIEIEEKYCEIAAKRMAQEVLELACGGK